MKKWMRRGAVVATAAVLVAVVVFAAITAESPPLARVGSGDAGVWVDNRSDGAIGRVNTQIDELDAMMESPVSDPEIVQSGDEILVVDRDAGTATRVDPATVRPAASIALPGRATQLLIAGTEAVLVSRDGRVWQISLKAFGSFDRGRKHDLDLGAGSIATTTPAGAIVAVSAGESEVLIAEPGTRLSEATRRPIALPNNHGSLQLVATLSNWAILDASSGLLVTPAGAVHLGNVGSDAMLQQTAPESAAPGKDENEVVFVATRSALLEVDLNSGRMTTRSSGHGGDPVPPVEVGGCAFAAWSDGSSWKRCGDDPISGIDGTLVGLNDLAQPSFRTNATEVVLNDPQSGQVWAVQNDNVVIDNWEDLRPSGETPIAVSVPQAEPTTPEPVPTRPPEPRRQRPPAPPRTDPQPASDVGSVQPPTNAAGTPPIATSVRPRLDAILGQVTLTWDPFNSVADPVLGYFAQSLGTELTTADSGCGQPPTEVERAPTGGDVQDVKLWTTANFGGVVEPGATYRFIVWGYNSAGCTASDIVEVTPRAAPGQVSRVLGEMAWAGADFEYRVGSVEPSADRYEIQRLGLDGGAIDDVADLAPLPSTPRLATGGSFGDVYTYRIRACNRSEDGAACGPWAEQAAPEPTLTFAVADLVYSADTGAWTWSSLPDNGALTAKVGCGSNSGNSGYFESDDGICDMQFGVPDDDAWFKVLVGNRKLVYPLRG